MKQTFRHTLIIFMIVIGSQVFGQKDPHHAAPGIKIINNHFHFWENVLQQDTSWWTTTAAIQLAENVLAYQRKSGGWPKNIDMVKPLSNAEKLDLATYPNEPLATIDNDATWSQMKFLGKLVSFNPEERYKLAFLKGLDYLLEAQYDNGGWPQYYPKRKGYYTHITYNDKAMIGVLELLQDIIENKSEYAFIDPQRFEKTKLAVEKGIQCILKTQVIIKGELTVWCAQHDEKTLAPIGARKYELPSLASKESVEILVFLMSIKDPSDAIIQSVQAGVKWLERVKLENLELVEVRDSHSPTGYDRHLVQKKDALPLWARFYSIDTFEPIYSDRDGKVYKNYADISWERRNDYGWIGTWPREIMDNHYKKWQQKYAPDKNLLETQN